MAKKYAIDIGMERHPSFNKLTFHFAETFSAIVRKSPVSTLKPNTDMKGATTADFYETFVVGEIPSCSPSSPKRVSLKSSTDLGSLTLDQLYHRYFSISKIDLFLKYNTIIEANDEPRDKVAFYMLDQGRGGVVKFGAERLSPFGSVRGGECYVAFNPSIEEIHRFDAQNTKPFYVEVEANYFASLLNDSDAFTGALTEKIANREFFGMKTSLVSAHHHLVSSIYDCPLAGSLGNLMIEGSLHRFVALQLACFMHPPSKVETMSARDRETMHAVKEYLQSNFQHNHSLIELSKQFGINQNKLKKSFKELFGVSVIAYLYNLKMEHARMMLLDQGMYVSEVAPMVGYKNSNHFATAFKRKFGTSPSRI